MRRRSVARWLVRGERPGLAPQGQIRESFAERFEFQTNPAKHITLLQIKPEAKTVFLAELRSLLSQFSQRVALVFVHGYNVTFEEAARRLAQTVIDLPFHGVAILYSWPSYGRTSAYFKDDTNVDRTVPQLAGFLTEVIKDTDVRTVHLLAHSMGSRAIAAALQRIATEFPTVRFDQVILAAPDIDAKVFEEQIAPEISRLAQRFTLYASSTDKALLASKKFRGHRRVGDAGEQILPSDTRASKKSRAPRGCRSRRVHSDSRSCGPLVSSVNTPSSMALSKVFELMKPIAICMILSEVSSPSRTGKRLGVVDRD